MKLRKIDFVVIAVAVSIMGSTGYVLYQDLTYSGTKSESEKIGTITFKRKTAQRKFSDQAVWQELSKEQPVYNMDSIRTVEDSEAVVKLNDGTEISLAEKTLVTLEFPLGAAGSISFESGSITAKTASGTGTGAGATKPAAIAIKSAGSVVELTGGTATISKENKDLKVAVSEGSASVSIDGNKAEVVNKDQTSQVNTETKTQVIEDNLLSLDYPIQNSYLLSYVKSASIEFSWSAKRALSSYTLEVSTKSNFSKIAAKAQVKEGSASLKLSEGSYYARISGLETGKKVMSEPIHFNVLYDTVPVAIAPSTTEPIVYRSKLPQVRFEWNGATKATGWDIQISKSPDFAENLALERVTTQSYTAEALGEGVYYWRVQPFYGFGGLGSGEIGKTQSLAITKMTSLPSSRLLAPKDGEVFPEINVQKSGITFAWEGGVDIDSYELIISRTKDMVDVVSDIVVTDSYATVKDKLEPGTYYWQLISTSSDGLKTKPQAPNKFSVSQLSVIISLIGPKSGTEVEAKSAAAIEFQWKGTNDTEGAYVFELSESEDFETTLIQSQVAGRRFSLPELKPGDYFWRVRWLDLKGNERSKSASQAIKSLEPLGLPELAKPAREASFFLLNASSIDFSWEAAKGAEYYSFSLYDSKGKIILENKGLKETRYSLTKLGLLKADSYVWRIQGFVDYKGRTRSGDIAESTFSVSDIINSPPQGPLSAISVVNPKKGAKVDMQSLDSLQFKWKAVPGATSYTLALYQKGAPDRVIFSVDQITATEFAFSDLQKLDVGDFYWTIKAETNEKGYRTRESPELRVDFSILLSSDPMAPEILSPEVQFGR